jgi:hypothetical protein
MEKKQSNRGIMIEEIIKNTTRNNIFEFTSEFKKALQNELDTQLSFETLVSDIESGDNFNYGQVQFKNENNNNSAIEFTIVAKNK